MSKKTPIKKEKDARFKCPHCDFKSKSKGGLTTHINRKHDGIRTRVGEKIDESSTSLNPQQESFCQLYSSDREFFGNGVQSYIEAYKVDVGKGKGQKSYEYCKYRASLLLKNRKILVRINQIYEAGGLNDAHVDKQLEFLVTQKAELRTSLGAVQEYNKLKKRTTDQVEHKHAFANISNMSDTEIAAEKKRLQDFFNKK